MPSNSTPETWIGLGACLKNGLPGEFTKKTTLVITGAYAVRAGALKRGLILLVSSVYGKVISFPRASDGAG
ncbi:hypothetical protein [uncultured Ruegeria sp.]|uniref:hypothetical protein n=1 Tax=uncultured Ruegeria sp. TaxID=259304 RepID=UPI003452C0DD